MLKTSVAQRHVTTKKQCSVSLFRPFKRHFCCFLNSMPRVVQVASSESHEVNHRVSNTYSADTSESDDSQNRNYNQRVNFVPEPVTTYLRFPVNYSLYNVTYTDSENDPYCLRCVIEGQVKKFKKDSRVWLHKSSERKRKYSEGATKNDKVENNVTANKNLKMDSDGHQAEPGDGAYRSIMYNTGVGNDLLSDLSSLADSDADLTYSEESSPTLGTSLIELREECNEPKSVRFDEKLNTGYRVHTISSESDESLKALEKSGSRINLSDETLSIEDITIQFDCGNESLNNIRSAPVPLDVSKIAPAICIERESFHESLLDYAVNMHNKASREVTPCQDSRGKEVCYNKLHATQTRLKMKAKKRRENRIKPYNLRSTKKVSEPDQTVPVLRQDSSSKSSCTGVDVRQTAASINLTSYDECLAANQMPSCSRFDERGPESSVIPTLFVLAGHVLYKQMKNELIKMS